MNNAAVILSMLALASPAFALDPGRAERDFRAANERALGGDASGAIGLYEHLLEEGVNHADLLYNLGNVYAQAGRLVDAVIAYERALKLAPDDEDVRTNLAIARAKLKLAEDGTEAVDVVDWVEPIVAPFSENLFAWIAVLSNALLFAGILFRRFSLGRGLRGWSNAAVTIGILALVLSGSIVLGHRMVARNVRGITKDTLEVRGGPHARFPKEDQIGAGERVRIMEEEAEWVRVRNRRGGTGWVPKSGVSRI